MRRKSADDTASRKNRPMTLGSKAGKKLAIVANAIKYPKKALQCCPPYDLA